LMSISPKLGELNANRFQTWQLPFTPGNAKQALLAFKGDVYTGLDADTFSESDFAFSQKHLRILSGLYGVLKPLDLIQPYRLEMGTKLGNARGPNLYHFWDNKLTESLDKELESDDNVLINLASNEYFKSVKVKSLKARMITPVFKDMKNGQYKMISFYAKKARGLMSAYIIKNKLEEVESLKGFDSEGYCFNPDMSKGDEWVFTRNIESA
jgi:cytoplasmic iron level regulating protein YaaA (DUF328/UPF0246 family)